MNRIDILRHIWMGCSIRALNGKVSLVIPWNSGEAIYHDISVSQFSSIRHGIRKICTNGSCRYYGMKG